MLLESLSSPASPTGTKPGRVAPGLLVGGFGCLLFIAGWALAFSGLGQYLLLSGLVLCAIGGWLFRGWRGLMPALLLTLFVGIVLLIATNATAAMWHKLLDSDAPAVQTPSPRN